MFYIAGLVAVCVWINLTDDGRIVLRCNPFHAIISHSLLGLCKSVPSWRRQSVDEHFLRRRWSGRRWPLPRLQGSSLLGINSWSRRDAFYPGQMVAFHSLTKRQLFRQFLVAMSCLMLTKQNISIISYMLVWFSLIFWRFLELVIWRNNGRLFKTDFSW